MCGVLHIFIRDFATIAHPLVNLTQKGIPFNWKKPQQIAMQHLKDVICHSSALQWLDYRSGNEVILAVDTSFIIVVGFISLQQGNDSKRYSNCFKWISLTEVKSHYSQVKLELSWLFHALQAVQIFIFGVVNFTVEMDTQYVKRDDQ